MSFFSKLCKAESLEKITLSLAPAALRAVKTSRRCGCELFHVKNSDLKCVVVDGMAPSCRVWHQLYRVFPDKPHKKPGPSLTTRYFIRQYEYHSRYGVHIDVFGLDTRQCRVTACVCALRDNRPCPSCRTIGSLISWILQLVTPETNQAICETSKLLVQDF